MMSYQTSRRWLFIIIGLHLVLWTLLPTLVRQTVMHDVVEGIAWGWQWQLGYDKHPPLAAWLCGGVTHLFAAIDWPVYLLAQLAVVSTFYIVWRLAVLITTPLYALISVFGLEGIIYYTNDAAKLTPDTMQTPLWALLCLVFYLALSHDKKRYWAWVGIVAGLCLWAKYQAPILFICLFFSSLITKEGRGAWCGFGPYLALLFLLVVISPHIIWSYSQGFPEIHYALNSTDGKLYHAESLSFTERHFGYAWSFFLDQLGAVAACLLIFLPFYRGQKNKLALNTCQRRYLTCIAIGPFLFSICYALVMGSNLIGRWAMPFFSFFPLWLLYILKPDITPKKLKQCVVLFITVASLTLFGRYAWLGYVGPKWFNKTGADAYFPAKQIAQHAERLWQHHYPRQRLYYVGGEHYLTAYLTVYMAQQPTPFMDLSLQQSPWINTAEIKNRGMLLAWQVACDTRYGLWPAAQQAYPHAKLLAKQAFYSLNPGDKQRLCFGFALVPPYSIGH